jgi:hypothetical protein
MSGLSSCRRRAYRCSSGVHDFESIVAFRGINLTINTTVRVDAKLTLGGQPLTINVLSIAAELQTDRVDVHGVVTSDDLQQLPQPTRTYEGLIGLLPGVTPPNPGFAGAGGTNNPARSMIINANGTSASGTNVSIDGVSVGAHALCDLHASSSARGLVRQTPGLAAPYGKYLDCADHKKPLCPPVDRSRRAYVTLKAILGYGGRAHFVFRTRLATSHC